MSSPPPKKREAPNDEKIRIKCPWCDKVLLRHVSMANHCFGKHQWSYKNNAQATPSELEKFKEKKLADKKRKKVVPSKTVPTEKEQEDDLFGTVSDSVIVSTGSDESDAEVSDVEPIKEGPGPSVSHTEKETKTKWSPTPRPVV